MRRNVAWMTAGLLVGCFSGGGGGGGAEGEGAASGNVSGRWSVVTTPQSDSCGDAGSESYDLDITQSGSSVTATAPDGRSYQGTLSGSTLRWMGSYPEQGGTTTVNLMGTLSGERVTGTASWTWSGPDGSCEGTSSFTATRISGGPTAGGGGFAGEQPAGAGGVSGGGGGSGGSIGTAGSAGIAGASGSDSDGGVQSGCCGPIDTCDWAMDGVCDCDGAYEWDAADCSGSFSCCDPSDPCDWADDGVCDCNGEQAWDINDCSG